MAVSQARHLCGSQVPVAVTGMKAYAWTSTPNQSKVTRTYLHGWPCGSVRFSLARTAPKRCAQAASAR